MFKNQCYPRACLVHWSSLKACQQMASFCNIDTTARIVALHWSYYHTQNSSSSQNNTPAVMSTHTAFLSSKESRRFLSNSLCCPSNEQAQDNALGLDTLLVVNNAMLPHSSILGQSRAVGLLVAQKFFACSCAEPGHLVLCSQGKKYFS